MYLYKICYMENFQNLTPLLLLKYEKRNVRILIYILLQLKEYIFLPNEFVLLGLLAKATTFAIAYIEILRISY